MEPGGRTASISAKQAPEQAPAHSADVRHLLCATECLCPEARGDSLSAPVREVSRVATGNQNAWLEISGGLEVNQVLYGKFCLVPTSATSQN